jgi:hypothetical protein
MAEVLYSVSKPRRSDVTGAANQVYESNDFVAFAIKTIRANNVSAISSVDTNGHFIHIHAPNIYENLQGEPTEIVGNASDVQGEFCMVKIKIEDLKFFPIMGMSLPVESEVATPLTAIHLKGTPLEGEEGVFIGSLNKWILFYHGMELPQGDVRTFEDSNLPEALGSGYQLWASWIVRMLAPAYNDAILNLVDDITTKDEGAIYIQPKSSNRHLSSNGSTSAYEYASARGYPSIAANLKSFFSPSSASPVASQVTPASTIIVRSAGDDEKEITAKIGQAKFALYNTGGVWDFSLGKVTEIAYPVWPKTVEDILAMARSARAGQLSSLLVRAHRTAKAKDQTSIFSTLSTIIAIPKVVAGNMIVGNIRSEPLDSVHGEASSLDPTAYLPQRDRAKVLLVLMAEQKRQNESNMDVPEAHITLPKTVSEKIGEIKTVSDFLSLMVNVVNTSAACADLNAMEANGSPHLLRDLAMNFILMINGDFTTWMDKTGGGSYLHWTLFQYFDNCHANIGVFCTDFNNANVFYTGRPASELDVSSLNKVALAFKAAKSHFDQCMALNRVDSTVPSICGMIAPAPPAPRTRADPEPNRQPRAANPVRPNADAIARPDQPRKKKRGNRLEELPKQDLKHKGMFHLVNPNDPDPFGNLSDANPDFVCQGKESKKDANGKWIKKGVNYFGPRAIPLIMLHAIGDKFLSDKSGWFDRRTFEFFDLNPKYRPLLGDASGPKGA